ncbi:hypothetical protein KFK09_021806 [Dendrobium nobile]|uniref:14-3-3 domain-containing protein n=1 Tax=Dendrobium nobile TaxID=94219 RepID=A0A8T3AMS1_DENNO|nr:hypothetical protein KFK09_021806 [Dendrobium nobile]
MATAKGFTQRMDKETRPEVVKDPAETREGLFLLARWAEESENYGYMLNYMKKLIQVVMPNEDLSENERNCYSSACMLYFDCQLNTWHHLAFAAADMTTSCLRRQAAREYQEFIVDEISQTCADIVNFIDRSVLFSEEGLAAKAMTTESRAFFKKMKGDYLRHVAMVKDGPERVKAVDAVFEAYNAAIEEALQLPEANLTRLQLALSLALFHAEICESPKMAVSIAREAFDMAKRSLEIREEEISSEITEVLEELHKNIDIWMGKIKAHEVDDPSQNSEEVARQDCKIAEAEQGEVKRACRRLCGAD